MGWYIALQIVIVSSDKQRRTEVFLLSKDQSEIKRARAAYARKYRREHPERVKEAQERYWLRIAEKLKREEESTNADNQTDNG